MSFWEFFLPLILKFKMEVLVCAAEKDNRKRIKVRLQSPLRYGTFLNYWAGGWIGQLKTKCCKQTYKQTDLYRKLREDISPIFKPTKKNEKLQC